MNQRELLYVDWLQGERVPMAEIAAAGWQVRHLSSLDAARDLVRKRPFHVGLAVIGPGMADIQAAWEMCNLDGGINWIALLPRQDKLDKDLVHLIGDRFHDYHTLPVDACLLVAALGHAYGMARLKRRHCCVELSSPCEGGMVGASPVMMKLYRDIQKVAGVEAPVLITGESGTGKELAARAIHERSRRADGPFVTVNCGAIPANLIQSELFGYEKGAFTGATQRKKGHIEAAQGGTIFLDEVGDLALDVQVNLLRFLQESTIGRVGSTEIMPMDVRVIAATHVDLNAAVAEGRFREDLFYRLHVLDVKVPTLRERGGDIELLARYFFRRFSDEKQKGLEGFSAQAIHAILVHDWPGNVREMINRIRRAMVMSEGRTITPADLGLTHGLAVRRLATLDEVRETAERDAINVALRMTNNNITLSSRYLGVSRVTLYRTMGKLGISATTASSALPEPVG